MRNRVKEKVLTPRRLFKGSPPVEITASAAELNILDGVTATTAQINTLAGVAFDRSIKVAKTALSGTAIHAAAGGVVAWQNPEATAILIDRTFVDVTTVATGACTLDVGTTAVDATTTSDNLLDGIDVNTAIGLFDNITNAGTNGKARQKLAAGKWVTVDEKTGDATGLVGNLYVFYILV